MKRVADYVIDFLVKKGINDIFLVAGGGIMYLLDAIALNKKIRYIANYHEQACAIAAEGYARFKNDIGVCLVTTGPGATNAITGVACAWYDSIPILVISGQAKRELIADYTKFRNLNPQEANIVPMVKPITKYAKTIMDSRMIAYELEKAFFIAKDGRPGPVWLDLPLDLQGETIDEKKLIHFIPPKKLSDKEEKDLNKSVKELIELIKRSKRPVLILGNGVRLAGATKVLNRFIYKLKMPILLPISGLDLVSEDNPYLAGKFGPFGQRRGNFVLQNSDLVIAIGASLNVAQTGFNFKAFAPKAKKVMINIEPWEPYKPHLKIDLAIIADAKKFIETFLEESKKTKFRINKGWLKAVKFWREKYPSVTQDYYKDQKHVNSYVFFDRLSDLLKKKEVIVTGIALEITSMYQAFRLKENQRAYTNANFGPMGWSLPGAIGACIANNRKQTICVTGDGSLMVNEHELQTISYYKLPIKIFVFNNRGYESIRYTQNNLFNGRLVGADEKTGVSNPDFKYLAKAHKIEYEKIKTNKEIINKVKKVLKIKGPVLCEVNIAYDQRRMPRVSTYRRPDGKLESRPLEDMWPFLPRKELEENMNLFEPISKSKNQISKRQSKNQK